MTIVEPHADDAFLSLGGHIEWWKAAGATNTIITVFSGTRKRARDAAAYAAAVGAKWIGLGAREPDDGGIAGEGTQALKEYLKQGVPSGPFIGPLGIKHPEHKEIRRALREHGFNICFLDQPYASTQANRDEINGLLVGANVVSYLRPRATKYRHIPLFKDQAKFFYYNPADKLSSNIELVVETP